MTQPPNKIRGIRSPIPPGTLIGRTQSGHGDAHLIKAGVALDMNNQSLNVTLSGDIDVLDASGKSKVVGLQGVPVSNTAPSLNSVLTYDGTEWKPEASAGGGNVSGPVSTTNTAIARWNGTGGTTLEDSVVTVSTAGEISNVADPTSAQDAATKNYVDTQIASVNVSGVAQNSFLVSGGIVVWSSAYTFNVSAATYYIQGVLYTSTAQSISLTTADPTNPRIDVIAVDNTGTVVKITGTAAAQPSEPDINPGSQLALSIVEVAAGSTSPAGASTTLIYEDDAGGPTEWNWTSSGSGITLNATSDPHTGTKYIDGTAVASGAYAQGQQPSGSTDPSTLSLLSFYLKSKATWNKTRGLQVSLRLNGVLVGSAVTISYTGTFGFNSAQTSTYQLVAIPMTQFAVPAGTLFNQIRYTDFGGSIGFELDTINLQTSAGTQAPVGITQAQADARYAPIGSGYILVANDPTLPADRKLTAGTGITLTDGGANGNLTVAAALTGLTFVLNTGATGTDVGPMLTATKAGSFTKCTITTKSSDPSVALTFKIKQNGTDIFSADPTVTAGTTSGTVNHSTSLTSSPLPVAVDDVFTIDVTSGNANWAATISLG